MQQNIKLLIRILPIVFLLVSCSDFLDVQPKDSVSDETTIVDKTSAQTAVRGIYRQLGDDDYYGALFQTIGYLSGDNIQWTGSQSIIQQFISHAVKADNTNIATAWSAIYSTINRANQVIDKLPGVNDATLTADERNALLGEAYFVRALAYFDLARTWGGVQLVVKATSDINDTKGLKRSTLEQTYAQVLKDLQMAEPLLPETTNRYRATRKTVWALLARFHLYQRNWEQAEVYSSRLIQDAKYRLLKPYSAFFANNVVATDESIFEISYSATNTNAHRGYWQPPANNGTRQWAPNDAFIALINNPAVGGNRNAAVAITNQGLWYGNFYYRSPATDPAYVLRIAEQYLIRAEARAQQGNLSGALADLDAVRDRAGLSGSTAVSQGEILLAIENERRLEFAFEPHRWYDLVRTGRAGTVLGVTDERRYVMPIPAIELSADDALEPNPGY
ncbi:RagB/SusD family nutrient uptake outer membrane protein [Chitinophaga pinensis]|uniref:RagB/SusD domain protein n=1 Tax=Chitinophaga pinensis (strain ATCC 43595 / DSM 2588 / LMG 13176 / NBRC 15968 / NCIMB 11800 / UQM 2034) TaxID=485918 RepID=A0A979FZ96_CHIPD|nr:RagB/SusD family nutrient uptake outer membrane protein [Chitinophaga pinensis]ACU57837.1 RagB/SusD domain protein [Chitinophaga pinensis DSM 2588]